MHDFITFKGLRHYPVGNALLHPGTDQLTIVNLSTPLDGFTIETPKATFIDLRFNTVSIETGADLAVTFLQTDNHNGLRAMAQWAIAQHPETNVAYLLLNSRLEGEQIAVKGSCDRTPLFLRLYEHPGIVGYNWMIVGVFDRGDRTTALTGIDCQLEMKRDRRGKVIEVVAVKSLRCHGTMTPVSGKSDPQFGQSRSKAQPFAIDELQISSSHYYPGGLPWEQEGYISQAIVTGQGMTSLVLTGAHSCCR